MTDGEVPYQSPEPDKGKGRIIAQAQIFQGPLPPPELFLQYERVLPGLANRITVMAERQANHRQKMERRLLWLDALRAYMGQILAFSLVLAGLAAGVYLIMNNKSIQGFATILTPLGTVIAVFLYGQRQSRDK